MSPEQRDQLAARLRTITKVRRASLALVVHGLTRADGIQGFAVTHEVPVMLPATEATTALLGMDSGTLLAEIREFWAELQVLSRPVSQPPTHSPLGAQAMPTTGQPVNVHVAGNQAHVSVSTGDHSAALTGRGQTAHIAHTEGANLSQLGPLFQELAGAIGELPLPQGRDTLATHVRVAEAEVGKKDKADPGVLKRALNVIKPAAEVIEGGEKIVALCNKAYQVLAPFL